MWCCDRRVSDCMLLAGEGIRPLAGDYKHIHDLRSLYNPCVYELLPEKAWNYLWLVEKCFQSLVKSCVIIINHA